MDMNYTIEQTDYREMVKGIENESGSWQSKLKKKQELMTLLKRSKKWADVKEDIIAKVEKASEYLWPEQYTHANTLLKSQGLLRDDLMEVKADIIERWRSAGRWEEMQDMLTHQVMDKQKISNEGKINFKKIVSKVEKLELPSKEGLALMNAVMDHCKEEGIEIDLTGFNDEMKRASDTHFKKLASEQKEDNWQEKEAALEQMAYVKEMGAKGANTEEEANFINNNTVNSNYANLDSWTQLKEEILRATQGKELDAKTEKYLTKSLHAALDIEEYKNKLKDEIKTIEKNIDKVKRDLAEMPLSLSKEKLVLKKAREDEVLRLGKKWQIANKQLEKENIRLEKPEYKRVINYGKAAQKRLAAEYFPLVLKKAEEYGEQYKDTGIDKNFLFSAGSERLTEFVKKYDPERYEGKSQLMSYMTVSIDYKIREAIQREKMPVNLEDRSRDINMYREARRRILEKENVLKPTRKQMYEMYNNLRNEAAAKVILKGRWGIGKDYLEKAAEQVKAYKIIVSPDTSEDEKQEARKFFNRAVISGVSGDRAVQVFAELQAKVKDWETKYRDVTEQEFSDIERMANLDKTYSLDATISMGNDRGDRDMTFGDLQADPKQKTPEEIVIEREGEELDEKAGMAILLSKAMASLSPEDRRIMNMNAGLEDGTPRNAAYIAGKIYGKLESELDDADIKKMKERMENLKASLREMLGGRQAVKEEQKEQQVEQAKEQVQKDPERVEARVQKTVEQKQPKINFNSFQTSNGKGHDLGR